MNDSRSIYEILIDAVQVAESESLLSPEDFDAAKTFLSQHQKMLAATTLAVMLDEQQAASERACMD